MPTNPLCPSVPSVKSIQGELDRLCLNQIKNAARNPTSSNYFAIQNISKLDDDSDSKSASLIKPSKFNLSLSNGVPSLTPNYSNSLINRPRLDLNRINFEPDGSLVASIPNPLGFGSLPSGSSFDHSNDGDARHSYSTFSNSTQLGVERSQVTNTTSNTTRNTANKFAQLNQHSQAHLPSSSSNVAASSSTATTSNNVASLFNLGGS